MNKMYMWNSKNPLRKIHLLNPVSKKTWCKVENSGGKPMSHGSAEQPEGRKICSICLHLEKKSFRKSKPKKNKSSYKSNGADHFLRSWEWSQVRYMALEAEDGKCQCCGRSKHDGVVLQVDHIIARSKRPDLALTLSNLQVLCAQCNRGKGSWGNTDWRDPLTKEYNTMMTGE